MRSEPTGNPPPLPIERLSRRVVFWSVAAGSLLAILTACAEGTSRDAEQGKQHDAERTSVVSDLQATESMLLLTGSPPATPPPAASGASRGN